jgi:very-short-patch-repair endonuclease
MTSHLEEAFANQWLVSFPGLPFQREFVLPVWDAWATYQKQEQLRSRKPTAFRADFAWPDAQVAVEINGGIWRPGGHSTGRGITRDITKTTLAQLSGWVLIPLSEAHIFDGIPFWLQLIADLITHRQLLSRHTASPGGGGGVPGEEQTLPCSVDGESVGGNQQRRQGRHRDGAQRDRVDLRQSLDQMRRRTP